MTIRRTLAGTVLASLALALVPDSSAWAEPTPGPGRGRAKRHQRPGHLRRRQQRPRRRGDRRPHQRDRLLHHRRLPDRVPALRSDPGHRPTTSGSTEPAASARSVIIASLGVAFLVGMAAPLVNYFYNAGA